MILYISEPELAEITCCAGRVVVGVWVLFFYWSNPIVFPPGNKSLRTTPSITGRSSRSKTDRGGGHSFCSCLYWRLLGCRQSEYITSVVLSWRWNLSSWLVEFSLKRNYYPPLSLAAQRVVQMWSSSMDRILGKLCATYAIQTTTKTSTNIRPLFTKCWQEVGIPTPLYPSKSPWDGLHKAFTR